MAVSSGTVSVPSNVVTAIVPATNANANESGFRPGNVTAVLTNLSTNTCYIGGSGVTSAGYRLLAGVSVTLSLGLTDAIYGLSAQNNALVGYIVTGG